MQKPTRSAVRFLGGTLLIMAAGSAAAQEVPAARRQAPARQTVQTQPAAQADAPQRTTATYEDWVLQCETQAGPPPQKICDMAQVTQVQGKNLPFSRVVLTHPAIGQPVKMIVQVPVNVSFAANVRIQPSDADPGLAAPFARCLPAGCFAEFDIKDDILKKFRAASGGGKLSFADSAGRDVTVPLSFNGFAQAYDALAKE